MLQVWFMRHGETNWNVQRRIQGWSDIPLNSHGRRQAELVARHLQGIPFEAVYSSDLQRALTTAKAVSRWVNLAVTPEALLRERRFGEGEGLLQHEARQQFPNGYRGRESDQQIHARARAMLTQLANKHEGRVLCISHGGFIRTVLNTIGMEDVPTLQNTSISRVTFDSGTWSIADVNWSEHLSELQSDIGTQIDSPASTQPGVNNEYQDQQGTAGRAV
jgi:broad specificity phosphatase PhoE